MVTGSIMDLMSRTFVSLKLTKGTSDSISSSLLIPICWKDGQQSMSAELPLSTRLCQVVKSEMARLITKASSWGWWTYRATSSVKLIIESSIRVSLSRQPVSWTFYTVCRQVFLAFLEDSIIVLPPTIILISSSGALDRSSTCQFSSWSLCGFSLILSRPTNHYNFVCLMKASICCFRSYQSKVQCRIAVEATVLVPQSFVRATPRQGHP